MTRETQPLDYQTRPTAIRTRPARLLSQTVTAAGLCLFALLVDAQLRFDAAEARPVARTEVVLSIFGAALAVACVVRGALNAADRVWLAAALFLFAVTAYVGAAMPRVIHN